MALYENYFKHFEQEEKEAKAKLEEINLFEFIERIIDKCSKESASTAQKVLDDKLKDLNENFYEAERNIVYNTWILQIGRDYRNDDGIFRRTQKYLEHIPRGTEGRTEKGINYVKDYILNDVGNYQDIMRFIESFEDSVRESMITDCLFNYFKSAEEKQNEKNSEEENKSESNNQILTLREIALLYYFKGEKITVHNQDDFAKLHGQENKGQKLYTEHYKRIVDDDKEIFQHRYAKKYLESIKLLLKENPSALNNINSYINKCD